MNDLITRIREAIDEDERVLAEIERQLADGGENMEGGWSLWGRFGQLADRFVQPKRWRAHLAGHRKMLELHDQSEAHGDFTYCPRVRHDSPSMRDATFARRGLRDRAMTFYRGLVEPMIVRYHNVTGNPYGIKLDLGTEGEGIMLMDVEALSVRLGRRSPATIRKHCKVVACDWATWRQLFNADEAVAIMREIPERNTTKRQGQLRTVSL